MIEGLKFDIKAAEMLSHLDGRKIHHEDRATFYTNQIKALEQGGAEAAQFSGGDPVRALKDKHSQHLQRRDFFAFLFAHVVAGEIYRLTESELVDLEFIPKRNHY